MRGAVTLAGVLTLPLALPDGSPFPARDVAILLAAVVILASLAIASIGLPVALDGVAPVDPDAEGEREVRTAIMEAAIAAVRADDVAATGADPLRQEEASRLVARLQGKRPRVAGTDGQRRGEIERELHLAALQAARAEAAALVRGGKARSQMVRRIVRELDLSELRLEE